MLITSRRSLILGVSSLIAAPALVRASSLMNLRGYDMDPWVIAVRSIKPVLPGQQAEIWHQWRKSDFNYPTKTSARFHRLSDYAQLTRNYFEYAKMRQSDVVPHHLDTRTAGGLYVQSSDPVQI